MAPWYPRLHVTFALPGANRQGFWKTLRAQSEEEGWGEMSQKRGREEEGIDVGRRAAIQRLFETVNALHRDMHSGYFNFDKLRTPADIERAREILATNGVIFIQNAVAPEMRDVVAGRIVEAWNGLMEGSHPELRTNSVEGIGRASHDKCTTGIWGNRSKRDAQPAATRQGPCYPLPPSLGLMASRRPFKANPFYSCVDHAPDRRASTSCCANGGIAWRRPPAPRDALA